MWARGRAVSGMRTTSTRNMLMHSCDCQSGVRVAGRNQGAVASADVHSALASLHAASACNSRAPAHPAPQGIENSTHTVVEAAEQGNGRRGPWTRHRQRGCPCPHPRGLSSGADGLHKGCWGQLGATGSSGAELKSVGTGISGGGGGSTGALALLLSVEVLGMAAVRAASRADARLCCLGVSRVVCTQT